MFTDGQDITVVCHTQNATANTFALDNQTTDSGFEPMYADTGIPISILDKLVSMLRFYAVCSTEWIRFWSSVFNLSKNVLSCCY